MATITDNGNHGCIHFMDWSDLTLSSLIFCATINVSLRFDVKEQLPVLVW
jgi:hypothetical protein